MISKKPKKLPPPLEEWEQTQVFSWRKLYAGRYPKLKLLHSSLNGVRLPPGLSVKMSKMGMTAGVPDICFPVRDSGGKYSGLYIELKRRGMRNNVSPGQSEFLEALKEEGYFSCVCEGYNEAIDVLSHWLGMDEQKKGMR